VDTPPIIRYIRKKYDWKKSVGVCLYGGEINKKGIDREIKIIN
jgi:hypothetical protein